MLRKTPVVALLTDFGTIDHYVGVMKGVLLSICPTVRIIDLSHQVTPQDVQGASYLLWASYAYLPPGTIVLAVVDPGVGTSRKILLVKTRRNVFVAPDNGVLDLVLWKERPREVLYLREESRFLQKLIAEQISTTFHGRDIFAPVGAHLAAGKRLSSFGTRARGRSIPQPFVDRKGSNVGPRILHVDRFGNIITNILGLQDGKGTIVKALAVGNQIVSAWISTYAEAPPETPCLIVGSSGLVEIVMNQKSAASFLLSQKPTELKIIS
jgi:S-adenosylmethionine hydrolase